MKYKPIILSYCLILFFLSCKKDDSIKPTSISGTWRWIYTYRDLPLSTTNPLTPKNTGTSELLIFNQDKTWKKIVNDTIVNSGMYSTGHGSYTDLSSSKFVYDSITYFKNKNGSKINIADYYKIKNDTLTFDPFLSGQFSSYTLKYGGSKWWVRQ